MKHSVKISVMACLWLCSTGALAMGADIPVVQDNQQNLIIAPDQTTGGPNNQIGPNSMSTPADNSFENNIIIGGSNTVKNETTPVSGNQTSTTNLSNAVIIGHSTTAISTNEGVSIGHENKVEGSHAIAIGSGATSTAQGNTIAIGQGSKATSNSAIAIGKGSRSAGLFSTALGDGATAAAGYAVAMGSDAKAKGEGTIAVGANAHAGGAYAVALGNSSHVEDSALSGTALGVSSTVKVEHGVALGDWSLAERAGETAGYDPSTKALSTDDSSVWKSVLGAVSVGNTDENYTRQITGVAAGSEDTDAVNVAQLKSLGAKVDDNTDNIIHMGDTIQGMNGRIGELDSRVNKVAAGAVALAALHPLDFDPDDKWDFAAGFGNYKNASVAALGLFYRPNEKTMLSFGATLGDGRNMVNAGVSVKIGSGNDYMKLSKAEMAQKVSVLTDENQVLTQKVATLTDQSVEQAQKIEQMETQLQKMMVELNALKAK